MPLLDNENLGEIAFSKETIIYDEPETSAYEVEPASLEDELVAFQPEPSAESHSVSSEAEQEF